MKHHEKIWTIALALLIVLTIYHETAPTGYFVVQEGMIKYEKQLDWKISKSQTKEITIEEHPEEFELKAISMTGRYLGEGQVKITLETEKGNYQMIGSTETPALTGVTGSYINIPETNKEKATTNETTNQTNNTTTNNTKNNTAENNTTDKKTDNKTIKKEYDVKLINATLTQENQEAWGKITRITIAAFNNEEETITIDSIELETEERKETIDTNEKIYPGGTTINLPTSYEYTGKEKRELKITLQDQYQNTIGSIKTELKTGLTKEEKKNKFKEQCKETCELPEGINQTKYPIKIEIETGTLEIEKITYVLKNLAAETNQNKLTGKTIKVMPDKEPDFLYMIPTILLFVVLIAIIAMGNTHLDKKTKKYLAALHVLLIIIITILLIALFISQTPTGAFIDIKSTPNMMRIAMGTLLITLLGITIKKIKKQTRGEK